MENLQPKLFAVVEFTDQAVEVVPTKWILPNGLCPFPESSSKAFEKLVKDPNSEPDPRWKSYECKVLKSYGV